jgi:hypothetical protein
MRADNCFKRFTGIKNMKIHQEDIRELTPHVIGVLDSWQLDEETIARILGVEASSPGRIVRNWRSRSQSLPANADILERISHIAGISDALRTMLPLNADARIMWLHQRNRRLGNRTPAQFMASHGKFALARIRVELDCAWGWRQQENAAAAA